jgi:hypothetical protein
MEVLSSSGQLSHLYKHSPGRLSFLYGGVAHIAPKQDFARGPMQIDLVRSRALPAEAERPIAEEVAFEDPPRPGELFFEAGLALAIPLTLALVVNIVLMACGIG